MKTSSNEVWLVSGLRTPFVKVDQNFKDIGAIELSVPVVQAMVAAAEVRPNFVVWGSVAPNLSYSNIAREIILDARLDPRTVGFTTIMACSTSMMAAIEAASMVQDNDIALVGGVESMSRVQLGLNQNLSDWLRRLFQAKNWSARLGQISGLRLGDIKLFIPSVTNRTTGLSMGEHAEITAQRLETPREAQDEIALQSHRNYFRAKEQRFFKDLIIEVNGQQTDTIPRANTNIEKLGSLKPVFDRSGPGTITAGNASLLTDGAAGLWVAGKKALHKVEHPGYAAQLLDWEIAAVDIEKEGLLMAPAKAIPRILERHQLRYEDIDLWEIHEAFAAQLWAHLDALQDRDYLRSIGLNVDFGPFPIERVNPNGGSIAIGHPFGATGARILSQALKELALMGKGKRGIVSICADGGLGTVVLLES